jgi:hypothetical protein
MPMKRFYARHAIVWILLLSGPLLLAACAPRTSHYAQIDQFVLQGNYDQALTVMNDNRDGYSDRDAALFLMEQGILAHYAGRYEESNRHLARAEIILEQLYTRSISKQAASFVINDNTIPYRGEDFEDAMLNLFMALNYVGLSQWEDALVEARKVDSKLNLINSRYEDDQKNVYKEDAFIRFLMGVLYEADGEINDAFISYRKAAEIFRSDYEPNYRVSAPAFLIEKMYLAAGALDFKQEMESIRQRYPRIVAGIKTDQSERAEVYCIHFNGKGPEKIEENWVAVMPDGYVLKVAYPKFQQRYYGIAEATIRLRDQQDERRYTGRTELMEDIDAIARLNLKNRLGRIKAKAIARATSKYLATKATASYVKQQNQDYGAAAALLVQIAGNIASAASEQADTRHWRLLPAQIRIGRLVLPPGVYAGQIDFTDKNGNVLSTRDIKTFKIEAGQTYFITHRTVK